MADAEKTRRQYLQAQQICKSVFTSKLKDYGASWRVFRCSSVTDQVFIKAQRIRSIEEKGESRVKEDVRNEYIGLVNYSIIALIQMEKGPAQEPPSETRDLLDDYDRLAEKAFHLMNDKNHDYDEAWREMRISSLTDMILVKVHRIRQIENNAGKTLVSEGADANFLDMINYALFALIRIDEAA
jgi:hypothetical protein